METPGNRVPVLSYLKEVFALLLRGNPGDGIPVFPMTGLEYPTNTWCNFLESQGMVSPGFKSLEVYINVLRIFPTTPPSIPPLPKSKCRGVPARIYLAGASCEPGELQYRSFGVREMCRRRHVYVRRGGAREGVRDF